MNYYDENEKNITIKIRDSLLSLPLFCKDFIRSLESRTTSKTRLAYCYDLHVFFNFLKQYNPYFKKNEIKLDDLDRISFQDIEEYIEHLKYYKDNENNDINNSPFGIKRKVASLRSFYNYFYNNNLIKTNPASKIKLPKLREKEIIRLDVNEVADLLDSVESGEKLSKNEQRFHEKTKIRDIAILSLLLGTGLRVSECIGINLSDVDLKNTAIRIKRKGAKESIVYFSDEVLKPLSEYIDLRKRFECVNEKDADALFISLQNKRMSVRAVEKLVKKYAKGITPLKHITPHKLRSTFGTNLYQETDDIYLVASILGHNDVNTTKKHYAAIEDNKKRLARNKIKLRDN